MVKEQVVEEVEETTPAPTAEEQTEEQTPEVQEENPVAANLKVALQKERQKTKDLEAELQKAPTPAVETEQTVESRFNNMEATTLINNKLLTDPAFKERADLVKDEMVRTGKQLEDADNAVVARLFKEMTSNKEEPNTPAETPPNQQPNTATPEEEAGGKMTPELQAASDEFDAAAKAFGQ